jgi:hypothetical protein
MNTSKDKTIVLTEFLNDFEANLALGVLRDNDIPCMLQNELLGGSASLSGAVLQPIRLLVFEKDLETARELLNQSTD